MSEELNRSTVPLKVDIPVNPAEPAIIIADDVAADTTDPSKGNEAVASTQDDSGKPASEDSPQLLHAEYTSSEKSLLVPAASDLPHIILLKNAFTTALGNDDFVKDVKKVEKLIMSLTMVDPETRVRAQLETNAYKTLRARAAKKAEEPGGTYVAPTQAEIDSYIVAGLKVWRDKQK